MIKIPITMEMVVVITVKLLLSTDGMKPLVLAMLGVPTSTVFGSIIKKNWMKWDIIASKLSLSCV